MALRALVSFGSEGARGVPFMGILSHFIPFPGSEGAVGLGRSPRGTWVTARSAGACPPLLAANSFSCSPEGPRGRGTLFSTQQRSRAWLSWLVSCRDLLSPK